MIDLKIILKQHPNCLSSRASFKSVLMDKYPEEKRTVNILTIMFECGIVQKIRSKASLNDDDIQALLLQLENDYGVVPKYSNEGVVIWAAAFDIPIQVSTMQPNVTPKYEPIVHAPIVDNVIVEGCKSDYETEATNLGGLLIRKFIGFDEKIITIPNQIDGIPVKIVGENAFEKCSGIEQIIVSEGIIAIENGAFCGCSSLTTILLPTSMKRLGNKPKTKPAMYSWLPSQEIPFKGVFEGCAIRNISLPAGLNFLGQKAFWGCDKLESIDLPNAIKEIGKHTFSGCTALKQVFFPDNLTKIGEGSFYNSGIESIDIPPAVREIDTRALQNCENLRQITLHEGLVKIGDKAFENCKALCEITIPKSVTSIGKNVFDITGWYQPYDRRRKGFSTREKSKDLVIACYAGSYGLDYARQEGYQVRNAAK